MTRYVKKSELVTIYLFFCKNFVTCFTSYPIIIHYLFQPDDASIGIGMTDGLFYLQHKKAEKIPGEKKDKKRSFYQYRSYGTDFKPADVLYLY